MMHMNIESILTSYKAKKDEIKKKLEEFKENGKKSDEKIFAELCFCICTPQSRAKIVDRAIRSLEESGILFKGNLNEIRVHLHGVRFPNNKARYIYEAREFFSVNGKIRIKERLNDFENPFEIRNWLVGYIRGIGLKEASHFLRNIGLGENLAILDVHVVRSLKMLNIIEEIPKNLKRTDYLRIEDKLRNFSKEINIPMEELDLLLWSEATGEIFK
ncbi:MAG: N-glycosylase/DNA lyase [Candidatus Hydrothermarchaeota archaeon]